MSINTSLSLSASYEKPLYSFKLSEDKKIHVYIQTYSKNKPVYSYYMETKNQDQLQPVQDVTARSLEKVQNIFSSIPNAETFFSHFCPRLIEEGTSRLELHLNIIQLMKSIPTLTESQLSDFIIDNLPDKTYEAVNVRAVEHIFGKTKKPAKEIKLTPNLGNPKAFLRALRQFFVGTNFTQLIVNGNALSNYILGQEEQDYLLEKAKEHLLCMYNEKRSIMLYLAKDGESMECFPEESKAGVCLIS